MDYPKIDNQTVTVKLNEFALHILDTYYIPDISDMVNKAIEFYFDYDYYYYERR